MTFSVKLLSFPEGGSTGFEMKISFHETVPWLEPWWSSAPALDGSLLSKPECPLEGRGRLANTVVWQMLSQVTPDSVAQSCPVEVPEALCRALESCAYQS